MPHKLNHLHRALLLRFPQAMKTDSPCSARHLLIAFAVWALVLQPLIKYGSRALGFAGGLWVGTAIAALLVLAAWALQRWMIGRSLIDAGFRNPSGWSPEERVLVIQALVAMAVVMTWLFGSGAFGNLLRDGAIHALRAGVTGLIWGIVQEWVYRGWLQRGLLPRCGAFAAVLLANLAYTFGPLHAELWFARAPAEISWGPLAAIFGIGLLFGSIYQRSGNLWLPALLHGLWPPNMR
ncbi:MAG: CPBP family intramembrane metalloprotease [Xanthomonadales bacterium]|nr:CPBP family intramembrane metalloprotease [Xanthomonadales bacterium]